MTGSILEHPVAGTGIDRYRAMLDMRRREGESGLHG
jgi:hypothetical protein